MLNFSKPTKTHSCILTLPWPARLWKPEMGAAEKSLRRTLYCRTAVSVAVAAGVWVWALSDASRQNLSTAAVVSVFVPLILLLVYPNQRRREARLPFGVELSSEGVTFRLTETIRLAWEDVIAYSLCVSNRPDLRRFEALVLRGGRECGLAFIYDPDEIDEDLLRHLLEFYLPNRERRTICSVHVSCAGSPALN